MVGEKEKEEEKEGSLFSSQSSNVFPLYEQFH
jgi:hypothetical protein